MRNPLMIDNKPWWESVDWTKGNKEYVLIIDNDDACDNKRITVVSDAVFINRTQYLLCTVNHLQLM